MKIAYIGAGSHFFESVSLELSQTPELCGATIALFDIDQNTAQLIASVSRRYSEHYGGNLKFEVCRNLAQALDGADAVISSIGVHGPLQEWHRRDVEAVADFGIMQTTGDTVGPTGISQGLRIIPPYLELAWAMERYCPDSVLLNHSNPMSAICRAISKYSKIRVIGYCHNVANALTRFSALLGVDPAQLDPIVAGVNHQVWLLSLRHRGKDVYPVLRQKLVEAAEHPDRQFTMELLQTMGLYLMGGDRHIIEFFPHARIPASPDKIGYGLKWRRDMISEKMLSEELTKNADELAKRASGEAPLILRDKLSPEAMGQQIRALKFGPDITHIVNVPNNGSVTNVPPWAVLETKCVIGQHGAQPVYVGELPPQAARWTLAQIYSHELMIEAAAEGSREKALQALACDPMVCDFHEPTKILDALVAAQGDRLAPFRAI
jgi:alpha-galactosidase/6-phospho-beta-glucosidase family protein